MDIRCPPHSLQKISECFTALRREILSILIPHTGLSFELLNSKLCT
jgi:hypothetical protein